MILTETNITDQDYFHHKMGYNVVCSPAITKYYGRAQGGGPGHLVPTEGVERQVDAILRAERDDLRGCHRRQMETANMRVRQLKFGRFLDLEEALPHLQDYYPIVLGETNANTGQAQNPLGQQVDDLMI